MSMSWVIIPVCLFALDMWTYSQLACTTHTVHGAGSRPRIQVKGHSAVNNPARNIVAMCAPFHVRSCWIGRNCLCCSCLLNLAVRSVVMFTFGVTVFLECIPNLSVLPWDSHKGLADCSNACRGSSVLLQFLSERNLAVTESLRGRYWPELKSRSCISIGTQFQRSSYLSHRIRGLDWHIACFWPVVYNFSSSVVWNHICTYSIWLAYHGGWLKRLSTQMQNVFTASLRQTRL